MGSSSSISTSTEEHQIHHPVTRKKFVVQRMPSKSEFTHSPGATLKSVGKRTKGTVNSNAHDGSLTNVEIERLKKEFEMFKLNTENEFANLEKVKKKYESENQRLRGELQALEKMIVKLKLERDQAIESEMRALERASAFEMDRNKIQKQFKIYRETRESELQLMLKTIKNQEASEVIIPEISFPSINYHLKYHDEFSKNELKKWSSFESETSNESDMTISIHPNTSRMMTNQSMMLMELDVALHLPEDDSRNVNSSVINLKEPLVTDFMLDNILLYITSTSDMKDVVKDFFNIFSVLEDLGRNYGKMLTLISSPDEDKMNKPYLDSVQKKLILSSTIFIALFGKDDDSMINKEILFFFEDAYLKTPSKTGLLVECVPHILDLKEINSEIVQSFSVLDFLSEEKIPELIISNLMEKLQNYFTQKTLVDHPARQKPTEELEVELCQCLAYGIAPDIYDAAIQWSFFHNRVCLPTCIVPEKYLNYLTMYVTQPGPLSPLLVMGPNGSGRSTLLAKWVSQMQDHFIVLHHSVISEISSTSNPLLIMRKFLIQMLEKINSNRVFSTNSSQMKSEFLYGLEKITSKSDITLIIVMDSIDLGKNVEDDLSWLVDPLPVNIRIVISADPVHCPSSWRPWPTLYLESPCHFTVKNILSHFYPQDKPNFDADVQFKILKKLHSLESSLSLLYLVVLCRTIASIENKDALQNVLDTLLECSDIVELYVVVLEDIHHSQCTDLHRKNLNLILEFIYSSYDGLRLSDLPFLIPSFKWEWWDSIMEKLIFLQIIDNCYGLLVIEHVQARTAINYFCFQENDVNYFKQQLVEYYYTMASSNYVSDHVANELPKLLKELGYNEKLKICCSNIWFFYSLYIRGRSSELDDWFKFVEIDIGCLIPMYMNKLKQLENSTTSEGNMMTFHKIANIYEALGHYLQDLNLFSEAVMPLQRTVELRETLLDPDHPLVAEGLHQIGVLQSQWGNFSTALAIHKQALDIFESAFGRDHSFIINELSCIISLHQHLGKVDVIPVLHERIREIKKFHRCPCLYQNIATILALPYNFPPLEISLNVAIRFNEMGVKIFWLHNYILAEKLFLLSLKIRQEIYGPKSVHSSILLNNLAGVYVSFKDITSAEQMYKETLNIRLQYLEVDSPFISSIVERLGFLYQQQNKIEDLIFLYRHLLDARKYKLEHNHPSLATAMVNLAVILSKQEKFDEALLLYEHALSILRNSFGNNHPQVLTTMKNLALLHYEQGHCETATELYKKSTELNLERRHD